jgi:DNA-binding response OmpR family regulator
MRAAPCRRKSSSSTFGTSTRTFTQTVKVHMNNLRRKINEGFSEPLIETIRGKGYVL